MPCDQIRYTTQVFTAESTELLVQALTAEGFRSLKVHQDTGAVSFTTPTGRRGRIANGQIRLEDGDAQLINPLKRAYSRAILKRQAERYHWKLTETSPTQYTALKRSF